MYEIINRLNRLKSNVYISYFQRGQVECSPVRCPLVDCKFPIRKPGECCDTCQSMLTQYLIFMQLLKLYI